MLTMESSDVPPKTAYIFWYVATHGKSGNEYYTTSWHISSDVTDDTLVGLVFV